MKKKEFYCKLCHSKLESHKDRADKSGEVHFVFPCLNCADEWARSKNVGEFVKTSSRKILNG